MNVIRDEESENGDNGKTDTGIWESEEESEPTQAPKKSQVCKEKNFIHEILFFQFRKRESRHKNRKCLPELPNQKVLLVAYINFVMILYMSDIMYFI
jgi:hypothetical protein